MLVIALCRSSSPNSNIFSAFLSTSSKYYTVPGASTLDCYNHKMHRKINVKQGSSNPIFLSRHWWRGSLQKIKLLVNEEFHLDLERIKIFRQNKLTHTFVFYKKPNTIHKQSPSLWYFLCCLWGWSLTSVLVFRVNLLWGSCSLSHRLYLFMISLTLFHYSSSSERGRIAALSLHPVSEMYPAMHWAHCPACHSTQNAKHALAG